MKYEFKGSSDLEFTGNWFVDSGILGFIFILEDIYGFSISEVMELSGMKEILVEEIVYE